tara:strand:- start:1838 stop:9361 length:7524 start_codon:yes stop_codon:yes gene_type:complete
MNEQALRDAYESFTAGGYQGTFEDYIKLINSNPEALQDTYSLFKEGGYTKPIEDFQVLLGVKKKDSGEFTSEVGLLEQPTAPQDSLINQTEDQVDGLKRDQEGEVDYFQGTFGDILRGIDNVAPVGIGDFVDDMARSIASGYRRGVSSENAADLLVRGNKATDEDIYSFIEANKNAQALPPSKEMQNYMQTYEENGKGLMGVVLGLVKNPTVIPEIIFSSFTSMATNTDSLLAGLSTIGTGAAVGATAGGVGAIPGAVAAIPYAFATAGSVLEMGATFAEVLEEEAGGEELTPDKVRELISTPEVYDRIRNKAVTRGLTIGAVDAFTFKIGGKLTKVARAAKSKPLTKAGIVGTVTEGVGGSAGEAAAQLATGEELDISDIALEGIAELPMGVINLATQKKVKPAKYIVNDVESTKEEVESMIETMTLEQLSKAQDNNIKIENDEQTQKKLQDKITFLSKKKEIKKAQPQLNDRTLDEITKIQMKIDSLQDNTTESSVDKKSELRKQIKQLTENQLDPNEQVTTDQKTDEQITTEQDIVEDTTNQEQVSDNLFINRSTEQVQVAPERQTTIKRVMDIAKIGAKSVRKILPNMRIVMHETQEQFENATNKTGRAFFDAQDTIHINLSKATLSTAPHEIFHAVFLKNIKTNKQAAQQAENMMKSVRKVLPDNSPLAKRIDEFAESYTDVSELQNEERAAELFGIMATEEAYNALPTPTKNIIIKFLEDLAKTIGLDINLSEFTRTDEDVINLLNTLSQRVRTGEEIQQSDIEILESGELLEQEQGEGGQVGTVEITEQKDGREQKAPSVSNDTRSFASLIQEKSLADFNGQNFVTNMYDFTNAGPTEIAPGVVLQLDGGKSYVPLMMERQGLKLGDKSNLAAFNTQAQAETFIRNSVQGNANLFMPHVGTKEGSWQFQQNLLEQLTDAALQNNILTNREIINTFNEGLTSIEGVKAFNLFKKKLGRNIKNLNIFRDNPKQLIELLDINNNYSPDLRKILNDKLSANKKYQEAVGVKNKLDFVGKFEDPLNVGSVSGDLVSIIEFDNKTFEISKPNVGDVDYHPSFAFTIKANINGIYQPTEFLQSSNVTKKYLKYNQKDVQVSEKKAIGETKFDRANVKSSAGSIPKVGTAELVREQRSIEDVTRLYNMNTDGFIPKTANLSQLRKAVEPFGFEAFRSREDQFGRGGGLFIKKPGQRRYKPPRLGGRQQVEDEPGASKERVFKEIEGIIEKSKKRGREFKQIPKNVISYLEQTKLYEESSDVQREALFRDVRKRLGIKEKSAPSVKRLFGTLKDVKKVTFTEKNLLYKRIKDIQEGAKTLKVALQRAEKVLGQELKALSVNGTITVNQMNAIMSRLRKTDLLNPVSRDNFIDYMTRVMADVDYTNKISGANTKLKRARKAVESKIGIAAGIKSQLQRVFSISPSRIPLEVLDNYLQLLDIFSQPKKILDLPTQNKIEELYEPILKQLDEEFSMSSELSDRLAETDQKVYKDGKLDYRATIQKMLDTGQIDDREFEVMRKYKSQILPSLEPTQKTDPELEAEKVLLRMKVRTAGDPNPNNLPSRDERNVIIELGKLIKTKAIESLSPQELTNLLRILDNIKNGYLPHAAKSMVNRLNAINSAASLETSIKKAKILPISKIYSRIKGLLTRKNKLVELVRRSPLYYIDQIFGDFATKNIYEATFGRISKAYAAYNAERKRINIRIREASEAVRKSLGDSQNRFVQSTYKQMVYLIQKEYLSNPGSKQVNQAADFLRETIKQIKKGKTRFREQDAKILQEILDKYTNDQGQINNEKLFKSFNKAEKQSIQTIEDINASNTERAVFTANIIRGESIKPLSNYVHLNVEQDVTNKDLIGDKSFFETFTKVLMPSTKAKSLIERTGAVSPLNFNVYESVQRGTKFLLMDYYLTDAIRTGRKTLNLTEKALDDNESTTAEQQEIFNSIRLAFNESVNDLAYNSFGETSLADEITSFLSRTGYRTILAGAGRFIAEFTSNFGFAMITDPKAMIAGMKLSKISGSDRGVEVLNNTGSSQTTRIYDSEGDISGKFLDPSVLQKKDSPRQQGAVSEIEDTILKYWNKIGKKWVNGVEFVADKLISTPDKLVMRPLWFGNFQTEFQKITGKKPDFDKIASNDEAYMNENSEAIKAARELADKKTVMAGATDNPFMGMLKGRAKPNQSVFIRGFNNFNNFMTRFLIFEYITARTGVANLMGKGELTAKQGGALVGGVMTRMVLYSMIGTVMSETLGSLFTEDDDEFDPAAPDKIKDFDKLFGQALFSAFTSLTLGRDFGNATKAIVNYGVEEFNESQLEFLRDGDYNQFRDALQYNIIPRNKGARGTDAGDFLKRVLAAYGPLVGTTDLLIQTLTEEPKKTLEARERQIAEQQIRLPLEIMGNLGLIPLYKDIRNMVLKSLYGDLTRAQRQLKNKKKQREEMLQGYESEADMKRYDPDLYDITFGPNSEGYDEREAARLLKIEERRLRRQLKDELYNYQPRKKKKRKSQSRFKKSKRKSRFD